jgi:hypothetical protein
MALPREAREANKIKGLRNCLGKNGFIVVLQGSSRQLPKQIVYATDSEECIARISRPFCRANQAATNVDQILAFMP